MTEENDVKRLADSLLEKAAQLEERKNAEGMRRFGIVFRKAYGVKRPALKAIAAPYKNQSDLADELWQRDIHEAYILSVLVENARNLTADKIDSRVFSFYSWDICDISCILYGRTPFVREKIALYVPDEREYVRRAGFVLILVLSVHDKKAPDSEFMEYLKRIEEYSFDDRNFVKKAVDWALRGIGKRNMNLHAAAVETAKKLSFSPLKSARWIGRHSLRELQNEKVMQRIARSVKGS